MRTIKFKALDNLGAWVYGIPQTSSTLHLTLDSMAQYFTEQRKYGRQNVTIRPETVCQFLGLTDKNDKEIFDGDILTYKKHGGYMMEDCILTVCYDDENACFGYKSNICMFKEMIFPFSQHDELKQDVLMHCEITSNVHDNSELIEAAN
jgi:uncharacterized phage protein (TIGR01671 family)